MADVSLASRSPLAAATAGRHGKADGAPGVTLRTVTDLSLTLLIATPREVGAVREQAMQLGGALPETPRVTGAGSFDVIWAGVAQWLVIAREAGAAPAKRFTGGLARSCLVLDQSDARAVIEIAGGRARDCLAKLCGLDLHPRSFKSGDTALTPIGGIPGQIWQVDEAPTYRITVPRSYAESVWHTIEEAAAEYGFEVAT